jgi:hypothetical protein
VRFFCSSFSCSVVSGSHRGFVIVEIECGSASYRGRGRGAVVTVYWSYGGDEGGGG